ncbi:DUF2238 domain-containing protein [Paenibacillus montanisoli]|uniref:DUF2238 domain-containing protein n=1 Tax=Paenibacillus montanisoli TaxID=2081970 RepID=A0A328TVV7_9BACL|nr:DUF2238 domain-containing protein [Paenibacillus montanisoli]RAP74470.1 DUF2238 domain-containing protein [Paenibacillus montanisoli]
MPFRSNHWLQANIIVFIIVWVLLAIYPVSVFDWWMENILTLLTAVGLIILYRYFRFSNLSYTFIILFLMLQTFGAHYAYGVTPLDELMKHWFDFKRNHYDRVVHFMFGLLLGLPQLEVLIKAAGIRKIWAYLLTPWLLLGYSAIYEIGEMYVVFVAPKKKGETFLGAQGDIWDAQHDMEVTFYASIIAMIIIAIWVRRRKQKAVDHIDI